MYLRDHNLPRGSGEVTKRLHKGRVKKIVKLGLLAEVWGAGGRLEWVLGAQPVIRSVF